MTVPSGWRSCSRAHTWSASDGGGDGGQAKTLASGPRPAPCAQRSTPGARDGKLHFKGKLRKGDELQDFFETFSAMVEQLRDRQAKEVKQLGEAIEGARKAGAAEEEIAKIVLVRDEMQKALEA